MDVWDIVKLRLALKDDDLKPLTETYIEEIRQRILCYCGIKEIPNALKFTWASMVIDAVRIDLPNVVEIANTVGGAESIKIGDTQVSPTSGGSPNTSKSVIDKIVLNYQIDLNQYRKLRW